MLERPLAWTPLRHRLVLAVVLLGGAALRLIGLDNVSPPGLAHDEVAHWLINRAILAGQHGLYFTEAYGHEAGYHYVQTAFMALLGDHALALRLPSAFMGLLLLAVTYALIRRLFNSRMALLAMTLSAVLFWPVLYSRLALRAIALPLVSALSAYCWWRGWQFPDSAAGPWQLGRPGLWFIAAGLLSGLSLYTYMAARAVPIFYILFFASLYVSQRDKFREHIGHLSAFLVAMTLTAAPLVAYLLSNPGAEVRIGEVDAPLVALQQGNLEPVVRNGIDILAMFGLEGDPLWRQNVAFLPVFEPLVAFFFYAGLLLVLLRWRQPVYLFLTLWLFSSALPSLVTIDAPSSIRIVNALPVVTVFPVIGLQVIHFFRGLSTVFTKLSPISGRLLFAIAFAAVIVLYAGRTVWATFSVWPENEEVRFVWQAALTEAAAYLDEAEGDGPVAVGGWTPASMDPPTMELTLQRQDLSLRYFDPTGAVIVPAPERAAATRLVRPAILPLDPALEARLLAWGADVSEQDSFVLYRLTAAPQPAPGQAAAASFGQEIAFLGYDQLAPCDLDNPTPCQLITYWHVLAPAAGPRRFFVHALDGQGALVVQADGLDAPAAHWQPGDLIAQRHQLPSAAAGHVLQVGVYDPTTFVRLETETGADAVQLP